MDKDKICKKMGKSKEVCAPLEPEKINSDVLGSYTGKPKDDVKPVQDADDL